MSWLMWGGGSHSGTVVSVTRVGVSHSGRGESCRWDCGESHGGDGGSHSGKVWGSYPGGIGVSHLGVGVSHPDGIRGSHAGVGEHPWWTPGFHPSRGS